MIVRTLLVFFLILIAAASGNARADETGWSPVEEVFGGAGRLQSDGVIKFSFPRTDLSIVVDGVPIKPAFALTSWLAFKKTDQTTMVMGDLVLTDKEVANVMKRLVEAGITVTALHNHLLRTVPAVMYMHVSGTGDAVALADKLRHALAASGTPIPRRMGAPVLGSPGLDTTALDNVMGIHGRVVGDGVYSYAIPRRSAVRENGMEIPPSMGMSTAINFEAVEDGRAAVTGDFVLIASEVDPVMQALAGHGIEVTALHNHMRNENPRLFFMHFWATGKATELAAGLRAVLDKVDVEPSPQ